ncbi:uncharacterized protein LOC113211001 [Frankliniella occidentalis]|uniref:Uncharacterized protein LOC113211001 n=1 Tax=Frankliniella occidentalis TaxID=133901 RepID=A0A9C6X3P5_FRAOC|nr:uncharacterized protein LOC113211001 [Frankliniella occidentalis]
MATSKRTSANVLCPGANLWQFEANSADPLVKYIVQFISDRVNSGHAESPSHLCLGAQGGPLSVCTQLRGELAHPARCRRHGRSRLGERFLCGHLQGDGDEQLGRVCPQGPYHAYVTETSQCPEGTVNPGALVGNLTGSLRHVRSSRYPLFTGQLLLKRDVVVGEIGKLAPEQIKIAIAKWDPVAGWRENFFRLEGVPGDPRAEVCNVVSTMAKDVLDVVSRSNPKFPNRCPFRKGTYNFHNFSTGLIQRYEDFPVFPYGRFRADLIFYLMKSRQKIVACVRGVGEVVPRV